MVLLSQTGRAGPAYCRCLMNPSTCTEQLLIYVHSWVQAQRAVRPAVRSKNAAIRAPIASSLQIPVATFTCAVSRPNTHANRLACYGVLTGSASRFHAGCCTSAAAATLLSCPDILSEAGASLQFVCGVTEADPVLAVTTFGPHPMRPCFCVDFNLSSIRNPPAADAQRETRKQP